MNRLSRRSFLRLSMSAAAGLYLAACQPIQAPAPVVQNAPPVADLLPEPLEVMLLDEAKAAGLHKGLDYLMTANKVPGMAAGLIVDGQVMYAKGHGVANVETGEPVTTRSLFQLVDLTHTFTATAALQLVEQGKLDLDMPVVEILPYFRLDDERYSQITVRHLLNESAGLPATPEHRPTLDWVDKQWASMDDDVALERYVRGLESVKLSHEPGARYVFCNMGFDIAGDVIAKVSGEVFETYVADHILQPLGMRNSTFFPGQVEPSPRVQGHVRQGNDILVSDIVTHCRERSPSVGLFSNVEDMLRWMQVNLNRGELDGVRILEDATYDALWGWDIEMKGYGDGMRYHSPGWFVGVHRSHPLVQYLSGDLGFTAAAYLVPEVQFSAVVMANLFTATNYTQWYTHTFVRMAADLLV